jgi:hypothetical protein
MNIRMICWIITYLFCPGWEVFEGEESLPLLDVRIDLVDNLHRDSLVSKRYNKRWSAAQASMRPSSRGALDEAALATEQHRLRTRR